MNSWTIKALYLGELTMPKGVLDGGIDNDVLITAPFSGFLLRNGQYNVLVDTGMRDGYLEQMAIGDVNPKGDTKMLLDELAEEGLAPKDIDIVIYTHLHYDHCGNGHLFKDTLTYVQKAEIDNLMNPYDFQQARADYFPDAPDMVRSLTKLVPVQGDLRLGCGLELYLTKGHSLGGQSIVVPTKKGRYVLTGDVPACKFCLFPWMDKMLSMKGEEIAITPVTDKKFLVEGAFGTDYFSAYDSHYRQLALAERPEPEFFLTSHEPENIYRRNFG